ncbi:MAG: response regulator [Alphaproteobacteria bacterium]|nr:response regulator [Alphaproteobacteria bacterium]
MQRLSLAPLFIVLALSWGVGYTYLLYSTDNPFQWGSLALIMMTSCLVIAYLFKLMKQQKRYNEQMRLQNVFISTLSDLEEAIVFDEKGRTVFTTHPHLYPHKREFLRKFLLKVKASPEKERFIKWITEQLAGEIVLFGGADGLGQQEKRWLVRIHAVNPVYVHGQNMIFVSIVDLTRYLGNIQKIKDDYKQLEHFVDQAPFGFFYANQTHHFLALNQTLANWLQKTKDELQGARIKDFIPDFANFAQDERIRTINLKVNNHKTIKVLYFPPSRHGKKSDAGVLCRLDDGIITNTQSGDRYMDQPCFTKSKIPSVILSTSGEIESMNPAFGALLTDSIIIDHEVKILGSSFLDLLDASHQADIEKKLQDLIKNQEDSIITEVIFKEKKYHATAYINVFDNPLNAKQETKFYVQFIDISQQARLKEQFTQSQKMQAVGQLAGGIAHDFNNLLTAMLGYCDLLLQRHLPNDASYKDVVQIKQNAERAANLVRQLLAFSRQQSLQPRVIRLAEVLSELSALLRRLIGVNIEFDILHGRGLHAIRADVSQIEQIIVNMVVNARDAMAMNGGRLIIKTYNYPSDGKRRFNHQIMPKGDFVAIEISDTGMGIPPENLERIFDPFFSTKEVGEGTGLGLSTVYGIMEQSNGYIDVKSTVGKGTIFTLYFPAYLIDSEQLPNKQAPEKIENLLGGGKLLLVEDEDSVRMFCARALREKGYEVLEAENGEQALNMINDGAVFDVLITDVVMPKMDGPTLNKKVRDLRPKTKTIFISGYAEDTFRKDLGSSDQIHFLPKPFSLKALASKVKEVIHS